MKTNFIFQYEPLFWSHALLCFRVQQEKQMHNVFIFICFQNMKTIQMSNWPLFLQQKLQHFNAACCQLEKTLSCLLPNINSIKQTKKKSIKSSATFS